MGASIWAPGSPTVLSPDIINVKDFPYLAVGDDVANDYAALNAAFAAAKTIIIPEGTYYLGSWDSSTRIFDFTTLGENINIITVGKVKFTVTTVGNVNPVVFYLRGNSHSNFGVMYFGDKNYSRTDSRGIIGVTLDAFGADWEDIQFDGLHGEEIYGLFVAATQTTTRVRNIRFGPSSAIDCNRGINCQNQGDDLFCEYLYTERVERTYFSYGCSGHRLTIFGYENYGTTGAVNISRAVGGYNTTDIQINYSSRDNSVDLYHVLINHIDLLGGTISGIKVHVDIEGAVAYDAVRLVNYSGSGGPESSAASSNNVFDVEISGVCDSNARPVTVVATYASKQQIKFTASRYLQLSQSLLTAFNLSGLSGVGATAAWSASVAPAIGDGTLTRTYRVVDGICYCHYSLVAGASTTFGTGDWEFTLPFPATQAATGAAYLLDSGTATFVGTAKIAVGSSLVKIYPDNAATAVRSNTPFTWAAPDALEFSLIYPV